MNRHIKEDRSRPSIARFLCVSLSVVVCAAFASAIPVSKMQLLQEQKLNPAAAQQCNVTLSSQLLKVATKAIQKGPKEPSQ